MRRRSNRIPRYAILGGLLVAVAVLLVLTTTGLIRIPFLDTVVRVTVVPAQKFVTDVINNTQQYFYEMAFQRELEAEFVKLTEEKKQLELSLSEYEELKKERDRLLALLGRAEAAPEERYVLGRVVAANPGNWFSSFVIDIGTNQGVKVDSPVVSADGLVGRVTEVSGGFATVTSIIDGRSAVFSMIERTRDNGMVRGNLYLTERDELCRMTYLPEGAQVLIGDRVITSGLDGVYPRGLLVGTVRDINRDVTSEHYVVVSPAANFRSVEEVLVLIIEESEDMANVEDAENAANEGGGGGQ